MSTGGSGGSDIGGGSVTDGQWSVYKISSIKLLMTLIDQVMMTLWHFFPRVINLLAITYLVEVLILMEDILHYEKIFVPQLIN